MTRITVLVPAYEGDEAPAGVPAPRERPGDAVVLTLVDNGKPNARALLRHVAAELASLLPLARVDIHSKPSAAAPIDADTAQLLAARSRLVITGVGD